MKLPNSISAIRYSKPKLSNFILGALLVFYFTEGIMMERKWLIVSGFMLWGSLAVVGRYKDTKFQGTMHYIFAVLFFVPSIYYAGWLSLVVPILFTGVTYWKFKDKDVHVLVLEIALFINTQILIL